MKKFLVRSRLDRQYSLQQREWEFCTAQEVAVFMWGKDSVDYDIFIRADRLPADCDQMRQCLGHMSIECTNAL